MRIIRTIRAAMARALVQRIQGRRGTRVQCETCHQWVETAFLMPALFGHVELRCDGCRRAWHQAIRDYYAHRAAEVAAADYALTRPSVTLSRREREGVREKEAA